MSKIKLDELLKTELGNYSAEPPANIWSGLNNHLESVGSGASSSTAKLAVKATTVSTKVILVVTAAITTLAGITILSLYVNKPNQPNQLTNQPEIKPTIATNEVLVLPNEEVKADTKEANKLIQPKKQKAAKLEKANDVVAISNHPNEINGAEMIPSNPANNFKAIVDERPEIKNETEHTEQTHHELNDVSETKPTEPINESIFIPNIITPNGDGKNDVLVIEIENEVLFDLKITDSQGNVMFESKLKQLQWDGMHQLTGTKCKIGWYAMVLRYQTKNMTEAKVVHQKVWLKL